MGRGLIPMLDAGHGYIINLIYKTRGKRSEDLGKGVLYEGVSNKHFIWGIAQRLEAAGVPFYMLNPETYDVRLQTRTNRADVIYADNPNTYVFSIHSNAGGGTGIEGFTSVGQTESDLIADEFLFNMIAEFPDLKFRFDTTDGDRDKEVNFWMLAKTKAPSFLLEVLFMDTLKDYLLLKDPEFRNCIMDSIAKTMIDMYYD